MKTLKWAILQLPKIDERWRVSDRGIADYGGYWAELSIGGKSKVFLPGNKIDIAELHAAAKTFGYEIGWVTKYVPLLGFVYYSYYINANKDEHMETLYCKFPAIAIRAAFIAAVEHKLKELQ
jgi:hypothetical protein